jgi:hypothetical protein
VQNVQDFQFYVTDDRYSVPSLMFVQTKDEASAHDLAARLLDNKNYHAVDVWQDDTRLFTLTDDPSSGI